MRSYSFLKSLWSPFKPFRLRFYFGDVIHGTPILLPRKWVKSGEDNYTSVPKKIGIDFVDLGWKIKWSSTDFRFEWGPLISIVFFKYQFCIFFEVPEMSHYWEAWLYYENMTSGSQQERIKKCIFDFPLVYRMSKNGKTTRVNYYHSILKNKYKHLIPPL